MMIVKQVTVGQMDSLERCDVIAATPECQPFSGRSDNAPGFGDWNESMKADECREGAHTFVHCAINCTHIWQESFQAPGECLRQPKCQQKEAHSGRHNKCPASRSTSLSHGFMPCASNKPKSSFGDERPKGQTKSKWGLAKSRSASTMMDFPYYSSRCGPLSTSPKISRSGPT